jgi:integrase
MTTPNILPTQWHRFFGFGSACAICNCSAAALVDYKPGRRPSPGQQHRATDDPVVSNSRWEKRYKSCGKLKIKPVAKHRHGHRQRGDRPRITEGVLLDLARAAAMTVAGARLSAICRKIGVKPAALRVRQLYHRERWIELKAQATCLFDMLAEKEARLANNPNNQSDCCAITGRWELGDGPLAGTTGNGQTLPDFFERVYRPMRLIGRSPKTVVSYQGSIHVLCRYAGRVVTLGDLSDELLAGCMGWMLNRGAAIASVNHQRRHVLALWRFAYRRKAPDGTRLAKELPEVERLREMKRVPVAWSVEEFSRLLTTAANEPGTVGDIPASQWWCALLVTLFYTGIRLSAAMMLRVENLSLTEAAGYLLVPAEHQKQKCDQRFKLPPDCVHALQAITAGRTGRIFGGWGDGPTDRKELWATFRRMIEEAGLKAGDGACGLFHKIRRTSATHVAAKLGRAAACDHLGHSAMSVTERYLDPRFIPTIQAADVLPRLGYLQNQPSPIINVVPSGEGGVVA